MSLPIRRSDCPASRRWRCSARSQAPELHQALERARPDGLPHVILDGKIVPCDRCKEPALSVKGEVIDLRYCGKAHTHGGSIPGRAGPGRVPAAGPGGRARLGARPDRRPSPRPARALPGRRGRLAGACRPRLRRSRPGIHIPVRQPPGAPEPDIGARPRNALPRSLRCQGERGSALLSQHWRTLQHVTAGPEPGQDHEAGAHR